MMWLWYDWQAAAVVNSDGSILDQDNWDGFYDHRLVVERLECIAQGGLTPEARLLLERFPEAKPLIHGDADLPEAEYPLPSDEALQAADKAAIALANLGVAQAAGDPDKRLEHLLRASDEMRSTYLTMESRLVEWVGLFLPEARFGRDRTSLAKQVGEADSLETLSKKLEVSLPPVGPSKSEWKTLREWGESTATFRGKLDRLENAIRELAEQHLPSLSIMLGPILSARLCVEAHGRMRLARLPAGTVQVLGAEKAFFNHLKTGAPPPKHGHIFMHPWISRSPRWVRGKISRTVAAKASIAAKVDAFGGEPWGQEAVDEIEKRIENIRSANSKPSPRRG
ncbi:MAG: NOP5/NOP56 family protein [Candidatus Poseidoniaceae archaeon]|nr:NOP5/NOP56 family protein [Candidatus Poseidoniaceae archaeon]